MTVARPIWWYTGQRRDLRHVALLLSGPTLAHPGRQVRAPVSTTSVAPTVLAALGLRPPDLDAVREQDTPTLACGMGLDSFQ